MGLAARSKDSQLGPSSNTRKDVYLMSLEDILAMRYIDSIVERVTTLEEQMSEANEDLVALQEQLADTAADINARLDQFEAQAGKLPEDAKATLQGIRDKVGELDTRVGDADGSDVVVEPPVEG